MRTSMSSNFTFPHLQNSWKNFFSLMRRGVDSKWVNRCLLVIGVLNSRVFLNMMGPLPILLLMLVLIYHWNRGTGSQATWKLILIGLMIILVNFIGVEILQKLTTDIKILYINQVVSYST